MSSLKARKSMSRPRGSVRRKIIESASELAQQTGPGNLSLDAVAARAGVSKGGLLYHFPTKTKLLEAMVAQFVDEFALSLAEREAADGESSDRLISAYLDLFVEQHVCNRPPPSGLLAALAEDPSFLKPIRALERELLNRMTLEGSDPAVALITYLVIHGIRTMELLSLDIVNKEEIDLVLSRLRSMIGDAGQASAGSDPVALRARDTK